MMRFLRRQAFALYVTATIVAGALITYLALRDGAWLDDVADHPEAFVVLAALLLAGEVRPVRLLRLPKLTEEPSAPSTTFVFALLLVFGLPGAIVAQAGASLVDDAVRRKAPYKALWNASQYVLALMVADLALRIAERPLADGHFAFNDVPTTVLAAAAYFTTNNVLVGAVIALRSDRPVMKVIPEVLREQAPMEWLLLCLGPLAALIGFSSPLLLPLLLLPSLTVYVSSRSVLEIERRGRTDALTELPNRAGVKAELEEAFGRSGTAGAIVLLDLDRFQYVNDTLTHPVGDQLLRLVAERLCERVQDADVVGRMGGDEFVLFSSRAATPRLAAELARRALSTFAEPFTVEELELSVEASAGVAVAPDHGRTPDELLQRADTALYIAKSSTEQFIVYDSERDQHSRRRLRLLGEMRAAIGEGQLVLHYQPQADLASGEIAGLEALVRWEHPELGLIMPDEFVPLAEHSALIGPLTRWVLREALEEVRRQHDQRRYVSVSVNVSSRALHDRSFPVELADDLNHLGVPAGALTIEVTESAVADLGPASKVLTALATMGIGVAIDDFGTGYSSLTYLKRLPVSEIKIDRSFVLGLDGNDVDDAIVKSTIDLAHSLKLVTVAEGVETQEVADALRRLGCARVQGFLVAPPMAPDELDAWLGSGVRVAGA